MVSKNLRTLITAAMLTVFSGHMVMAGNPLTSDSFENVAPRSSVVEVVPVSKVKAEAPVKDKKQEVALQLLEDFLRCTTRAGRHMRPSRKLVKLRGRRLPDGLSLRTLWLTYSILVQSLP
jgi:hypothetical protein